MAALRLHQNSTPQQTKPPQPPKIGRTNSLNQRANSLKTYTYHPKGSYTPGQATIPNSRRFSSLNSNSNNHLQDIQNNYLRPPKKITNRHSSLNSNNSRNSNIYHDEQPHDEEDGETIITTQTTKVVDSQGRVQSITTKTIKTLPDGSNIIETTTKNISRSNSLRNNSLRTNSFRNNSMTSSPQDYNLHKIDEDLQDFEYNYELDNELPLNHPDLLELNRENVNLSVDTNNSNPSSNVTPQLHSPLNSPKISTTNFQSSPKLNSSPQLTTSPKLNASPQLNATSQLNGVQTSPAGKKDKPLKSILKSPKPVEAGDDIDIDSIHSSPNHPYKTIGNPLSDPPKFKVPQMPKKTSPVREKDITSNASATSGSSIKFNDNVETIPIYEYEKPKVSNQELYDKAMKVAMEKVYGSKKDEPLAPSPEIKSVPQKIVDKKDKQDKKLQVLGHSGINDNYIYENHHKDFKIHSMRDDKDSKAPSRKERAKLEKKQRKDYEKQMKEDEKRRKEEEKRKLSESKSKKKSPIRGLFSRKKKDDEATSINHSFSDGVLDGSPRGYVNNNANANDNIIDDFNDKAATLEESPKTLATEEVLYEKVDPLAEAVEDVALVAATAVTTSQPLQQETVTNKRYSEVPSMPTPQIKQEQTFDSPQAFIRPRPLPRGDLESLPSPNLSDKFETPDQSPRVMKDVSVARKSSAEFKQPGILTSQTSKSNISKPEVSPIIIGNGKFDSIEAKDKEIPRPLLNDISTDGETDLDEYEDVLGSPGSGSGSRRVSRNNSVKSPKEVVEEDSHLPLEQPIVEESNGDDVDGDDDTILNKDDKNIHTFANFNNDMVGTKEPQTLSDLIKLGRMEDTDDSFQPPNAYDSDSDASSKFSADLSAAIRRISDYPNEDGQLEVDDDNESEIHRNENREAFVIDEPLTLTDKNVKIYEPINQDNGLEASSAFASPTEENFTKKNDSAPLTESSDDRSPQPSRSTLATNDKGLNNEIPGVVVDKHGVFTNKPRKAKKSFGKKILKLFVNSYDQDQR